MQNFIMVLEMFNLVHALTIDFETTDFMALISMLMDQHGADHHMTSAETITMTETILDSQRQVHSEHGMMEASFD